MSSVSWDKRRFWIYRYDTLYRPYFALGYITVALFALFSYFDQFELGEQFGIAVSIRLVIALGIVSVLVLLGRYRTLNAPLFEAMSLTAGGLFIVWIGELAIDADNYFYHSGIIMVLCYLGTFSRMPWRYGLVTAVIVLTPYLFIQSPQLFQANPAVEEERLTVIAFAAVVGVVALYHRQRQTKIRYRQWLQIRSQEIKLRRSAAQQQRLSETDSLTQIHNRTYLGKLMQQPDALQSIQQVLMVDIDFFKHLNDLYGHLTGDLVLQRVAAALKQHTPTNSYCIRYGGEEFLVLSTSNDERLAERLRQAIEQLHCEGVCQITISIGSSSFDANSENIDKAIDQADRALYRAKENGRNRHVAFIDAVA